jgi:hypothetical protein
MQRGSAKAVTPTVVDAETASPKKLDVFLVSDLNGSPELILAPIEGYVRLRGLSHACWPDPGLYGTMRTTFSVVSMGIRPIRAKG